MAYDFQNAPDRSRTGSLKWTFFPEDVLPAWVADTDFPAPPPILEALHKHLDHGVLGYEFPRQPLLQAIADRMARLYGWHVEPEAIVATPGIIAAFTAAAWAVCEPGQGILIQPPVYPPFLGVAGNVGLVTRTAPLVAERRESRISYRIDLDAFRAALNGGSTRTGMFLLCNPHNPTGQAYAEPELRRMAEACLEAGTTIVSDEIHSELLLGGTRHVPVASLSPEIEKRTITLVAPSKTYNVPGLFCGFAIIPDEALRERFRKASERMIQHVSSLSLTAAQVAYSGACDPWLRGLRAQLTANRDLVVEQVRTHMPRLAATVPDATYLAWLDCSGLDHGAPSAQDFFLERARVGLNKGEEFGQGGEGFVRLNFGTTPARLREILDRMAKAVASLS